MAVTPSIERRDSGPDHLDKTSDSFYESELTDEQVEAQDSLFGVPERNDHIHPEFRDALSWISGSAS